MEPKPIEPQDIRVGDRVQIAWVKYDAAITAEFTVGSNSGIDHSIKTAGDGPYQRFGWAPGTWTLLDRPEPARPVGSHWRGEVLGGAVEYVRNQNGDYLPIRQPEGWSVAALRRGYEDDEIARLTPIPAFDPATLWPDSPEESTSRWCMNHDSRAVKTCTRPRGHDGLHAAYGPDDGAQPVYVWGDPR